MKPRPRPKLATVIADAIRHRAVNQGLFAFVPWILVLCFGGGVSLVAITPSDFWMDDNRIAAISVYSGLLAFNGLLLSLGWFAFSKIYEIITNDRLGRMLSQHSILEHHLGFIDITHMTLIASAVMALIGLTTTMAVFPSILDKAILATCVATTCYSLARAFSATKMMNDLVWEQSEMDRNSDGPPLTSVKK
jgi:hypothetical protein